MEYRKLQYIILSSEIDNRLCVYTSCEMGNTLMNDNYMLQTLSNAIDVLYIFETEHEPLTISELVKKTNLNRTTLYRILSTLRSKGLIEMDPNSGKYRLGIKIVQLSSLVLQRLGIREVARPYLESLQEKVNETIHLCVLNDKKVIFIDKLEVAEAIFMGSYIGWAAPLYCTATGKLLLGSQNKDYIDEYLKTETFKQYTSKTLIEPKSLQEDLERIKTCGYSIDDEEMVEGLTCYAAPIVDNEGVILASISVSGPTSRMISVKEKLIPELLDSSKQISQKVSSTSGVSIRWM